MKIISILDKRFDAHRARFNSIDDGSIGDRHMSKMNNRLGITAPRRIIGATMVAAMYAVAFTAFARPHTYDYFATVNSPFLPSNAAIISLVAFSCACILSPFILYPCLFNRFPRWTYKYFTELQLEAMARQFFGITKRGETKAK